jgi:hypothetical protein
VGVCDVEVEAEACQPVRAKDPIWFRESSFRAFLSPLPGLAIRGQVPIACAMGYYLAPLPGLTALS